MIMLGSDGPNVNKKVFRLINNDVLNIRKKSLINIGTCNIHIAHNSFLKSLNELGMVCSDLCIALFYYFNEFPSRTEDLMKIQKDLNVHLKKLIKHVPTRWLTLKDSCERVLELFDALENYFLVFIPKNISTLLHTTSYKNKVAFLKSPTLKAELNFVISSASIYYSFSKRFQTTEPLVHILYDELQKLCFTIAGSVCTSDILKKLDFSNID